MPSIRRIKSVKWDEDDLDDYYSDDYSDEDNEGLSNLKISDNKSPKIATKSNVSPKTPNYKPSIPTPRTPTFCNPKRLVNEYKNPIESSNHRYPLNVVVLGAVDAGKSTLLGHFLTITGCVDKKLKNLKHLAWIMDQGEDERDRGITIDPTKCQFNLSLTNIKDFPNYTNSYSNTNRNTNNNSKNNTNHSNLVGYEYIKVNVIDTPGHHDLIQNLVMGAVFANSAVIIVDSNDVLKSDIFGVYFSEHMLLLYFLGIRHYAICVNKIDRFEYSEEMYNKVVQTINKLVKIYEKSIKLIFLPVSGLNGDNLVSKSTNLEWYKGPTLIESLQLFALEIIKRPVVIYDKVVCHIFDLWESGKNTVCCSCFVEGNKMKVPTDMFTLPNSVQIKCSSVNYLDLNFVDSNNLDYNNSLNNGSNSSRDNFNNNTNNNEYNLKLNNGSNNSYLNDFVDSVEMKGTEIANLVTSKIMIDYNTHSKIRNNTSSIVKTNTFIGFIYLNTMNKMKLTIGQNVELYVGYTKQSANIRSLEVIDNYKTLVSKRMYTISPGQFAFIEFSSYLPILVEPISRSSNFIQDLLQLFKLSENKSNNGEYSYRDNEIEHVGILSRLLVRSNGSFVAGGVVVNNK